MFGLPAQVRKPRLASLIRAVDLLHVSGDLIDGFSNGMSARLAVATSLINEPDLLIWDEPTHGLDVEARRSILELIKTLARDKTLIVCSHNLSDIDEVCNHAAVLSRGHMIYFGSLQDLKGRMKRNHYEVDLEGDQKTITKAMQTIKGMTEFKLGQPAAAPTGTPPDGGSERQPGPGRGVHDAGRQQGSGASVTEFGRQNRLSSICWNGKNHEGSPGLIRPRQPKE